MIEIKTPAFIEREKVYKAHYDKFGVWPVETGATWMYSGGEVLKMIEESIAKGVPYVEDPLPDGGVF